MKLIDVLMLIYITLSFMTIAGIFLFGVFACFKKTREMEILGSIIEIYLLVTTIFWIAIAIISYVFMLIS